MKRRVILRALGLSLLISGSAPVFGAPTISYSDLWDVSKGTTIVGYSPTKFYDIRDMFGANDGTYAPERGRTLFSDFQPLNYQHWVEFRTSSVVTLNEIVLWAGNDGPGNAYGRAINRFKIEAWSSATSSYQVLYDSTVQIPYSYVDNIDGLLFDIKLATPVTADKFKASFYQGTTVPYASGPRIIELDAYYSTSSVPAPSALLAATGGYLSVMSRRRRHR